VTETFQNTAEGGTNTTAVTIGNSGGASGDAWTSVTSTPTFTTVSPLDGLVSYTFSATATQFLDWDAAAAWADFAYYFYFDFPSNPVGALHTMANFRSLSGSLGSVNITTSGELTFTFPVGGAGPTVALTAATRYRVEGQCTGFGTASSTAAIQVYAGASTTPLDSISATGATTALPAQRVRWGRPSGTTTLATGLRQDTYKIVFGSASVITPISPAVGPHPRAGIRISDRPRRLWDPRRSRELLITGIKALGSFNADVTGQTIGGGTVTSLLGVAGTVAGSTTAGGAVTALAGDVGAVTGTTTAGGTVTGVVARFGATTGTTTATGAAAGLVGDVATVTGSTTASGTVTGLVARTAAVTGSTTAGGTVNASTVTGLLADVTGTTTAGAALVTAMTATAVVTGTTTSAGTVSATAGAVGAVTGSTSTSGAVTAGTVSTVTGTTTAAGTVAGQVAASTTVTGSTTGGGTVVAAVGKLAAVTGTTAMSGTLADQIGTALAVTGSTTAGGFLVSVVNRRAQVSGATVAAGEVAVGSATVGEIHQGSRFVGGPQPGRRPRGGPRSISPGRPLTPPVTPPLPRILPFTMGD
jgi:hypothetical protein